MGVGILLIAAIAIAGFVGISIGGSDTGVSFGPAVGSNIISTRLACLLMGVFAILGGVTVGPNVVNTMSNEIVPSSYFTEIASVAILLFIGISIAYGVMMKISVATSQIAVGALMGMGAALSVLNWHTIGVIFAWWAFSSVVVFWISAVIGRYFYGRIVRTLGFENDTRNRLAKVVIILVGCYVAFSDGSSNVANVVAPLVGSGSISLLPAVAFAGLSIGGGAFLLGSRTIKTIGKDITHLSLEAALIVEVIGATTITFLSWSGIPASLTITLTMCIIGLGWGRATRHVPLIRGVGLEKKTRDDMRRIEKDRPSLYDVGIVRKITSIWLFTPMAAFILSFLFFRVFSFFGPV